MPADAFEEELKAYRTDSRTACQYGSKCYQKNPAHHSKYKHPPKKPQQRNSKKEEKVFTGRKRSSSECDEDEEAGASTQRQTKQRKDEAAPKDVGAHELSPSPSSEIEDSSDPEIDDQSPEFSPKRKDSSSEEDFTPKKDLPQKVSPSSKDSQKGDSKPTTDSSPEKVVSPDKVTPKIDSPTLAENGGHTATSPASSASSATKKNNGDEMEVIDSTIPSTDPKKIIADLFLVEMPVDFYQFYEFCSSVNAREPSTALKLVDLKLVGPYDVLNGNIKTNKQRDPEKYLRHWRYFYDPPEFQTVLKGNDKEGLHYGYWRDSTEEKPIFVAKNCAINDCKIVPVAPNIFGAVNLHIDEKLKKSNPFEKGPILKLSKQLKAFAKDKGVDLEKDDAKMRDRKRKVVAKTFHGAGIVVPYEKKTQLGYRDLAATDSQLKKILGQIDEAETDDERKKAMSKIEEIVRLATIAADECDFGTCLELGHDLFSSGCRYVQRTGLQMLATAYNLLDRQKLLKIAEAHAKDRKKGSDLSVL